MNTFGDLTRRVEGLTTPHLDVDALVAQGERRLRRRRLTVATAAAAAIVVLAVCGLLVNAMAPRAGDPSDHPTHHTHTSDPVTREIVYSDSGLFTHTSGSIQFGDQPVDTGDGFVHIDVTDDGFIYTSHGRAWFSDGGTPLQIGVPCAASAGGLFSNYANRVVMSANAGSVAAWFDCTEPARASLVVYDTSSSTEVARRPIALCPRGCELVGVTADYVYLDRFSYAGFPKPEYRFGIMTHQVRAASPRTYARDLVSHPRGLVVGDTWQTGTATTGIGQDFSAVGSRLVPLRPEGGSLTSAFDTATRHALQLRLPAGYHRDPNESFSLFEWLGDDTVAVAAGGGGNGVGDLLTCHLSSGRCDVTVKRTDVAGGREAGYRILPNFPLPG